MRHARCARLTRFRSSTSTAAISQLNFHCGHVVAEANGGLAIMSNLVPVCGKCNTSMGTTNLAEFARKHFGRYDL